MLERGANLQRWKALMTHRQPNKSAYMNIPYEENSNPPDQNACAPCAIIAKLSIDLLSAHAQHWYCCASAIAEMPPPSRKKMSSAKHTHCNSRRSSREGNSRLVVCSWLVMCNLSCFYLALTVTLPGAGFKFLIVLQDSGLVQVMLVLCRLASSIY